MQLLVDGARQRRRRGGHRRAKQAIQALATAYEDYFDLTTDAVAIPLSACSRTPWTSSPSAAE